MNAQDYTVNPPSVIGQNRGISRIIQLTLLLLSSCAPGMDVGGPPFSVDLLPPELQMAVTPDGRSIRFVFDEEVNPTPAEITVQPELPVASVTAEENSLTVAFAADQLIGKAYTARVTIGDNSGNTLSFLYSFSGWNPRVPEILINELNPRGSGNNPDCIELFTVTGGNLGGLCLKIGTSTRYSSEIIFPAIEIPDGEYILIHAKAEGIPEEIDELEDLSESGGLLASDTARDFWIPGAPGLPGNNGAVTLYNRKGGEVIDAVLWSNRADDSNDEKLGWTSEGYIFASELGMLNAWDAEIAGVPYPSEAIDVSHSTATRSLCRAGIPEDSNRNIDWHTVPTRGGTFGGVNTDEVYVP
ncbi:MAG: hypothetical protein DRZ90_02825 [Spirochaetes bacterium]|nr:MAG: hypothetical protein DRZ90_02825 [Spirochaetota bacterium]